MRGASIATDARRPSARMDLPDVVGGRDGNQEILVLGLYYAPRRIPISHEYRFLIFFSRGATFTCLSLYYSTHMDILRTSISADI